MKIENILLLISFVMFILSHNILSLILFILVFIIYLIIWRLRGIAEKDNV